MRKFIGIVAALAVLAGLAACGGGGGGKEAVALVDINVWPAAGGKDVPGSKPITYVKRGQKFTIVTEKSDKPGWTQIKLTDGKTTGWLESKYVFVGAKQLVSFPEGGSLYAQPDGESPVIGKYQAGAKGLIVDQKEGWCKINLAYGWEGWVKEGTFERGSAGAEKKESAKEWSVRGATITASSWVDESEGYAYTPDKAFDGNKATSWQVNKGNAGVGEWIEIKFPQSGSYNITLINGFAHSDAKFGDLYKLNARVKSVKVLYGASLEYSSKFQLQDDTQDLQALGRFDTDRVRIVIEAVYPGSKWQDTSVSEIQWN